MFHGTKPAMEAPFVHSISMTVVTSMSGRMSSRLLNCHDPPTFFREFHSGLCVTVEHGEVGHYHGDRQGDHEDARESTQGTNNDPRVGLRHHVTVADCCHGDYSPPKALRYAFKIILRICMEALGVVDEACKDDHAEDEEENQKCELL